MKTSNETESFNRNTICLHCFIRAITSCASLWVRIVLCCKTSDYLQLSLGFWIIASYSSLLLTVIFLREKCVLFDLDQGSEIDMSWENWHSWLAETSFAFGFPLSGPMPRQSCSSVLPWVAAASACLWCQSSCELVNLWGKPLSLGVTLLFPPAPNSVLISQHNFHCFPSCTSWICFGKSRQYLLSRGKLSPVIKPCLEVWEAEFSVFLSHCFLCAFG